jgi:hypothetical protein
MIASVLGWMMVRIRNDSKIVLGSAVKSVTETDFELLMEIVAKMPG